MAAFGSVTMLVASLLALLCSVVGAPMDPNNYFNHLGRPFDSVSHAFHSNQPAEHESGFGWNDSDPPVDYRYGSQGGLSGPPAREHNARNAAARNHERQGGASRYSPYMTSNNPVGGALSSRGGAESSGQYTGFQHQPSALIGPGPGSYGVFEPRPQHQHLSNPGGGGSFDLENLPEVSEEEIDEFVGLMNSPDVVPPPPSALTNAAEAAKLRRSELARERARVGKLNKEAAIALAREMLPSEKQSTIDDLEKYGQNGDPTSDPASVLAKLTYGDLLKHAEVAFRRESTALQPHLQSKAKKHLACDYVYSTEHQSAVVQALINRRLEISAGPNVNAQRIRVTADPSYKNNPIDISTSLKRRIDRNWAQILYTPAYHEPFWMNDYKIVVIGRDSVENPPPIYAIHVSALDDLQARKNLRPSDTTGASSRSTGEEKAPSVFLGHISLEQ